MSTMSIGEVARRCGIATSTIRYYESIGLLAAPERISGRRIYESTVIQQLTLIRAAQRAGWSLGEIKEILHGFPDYPSLSARWKQRAPQKIQELDALIEQTQRMKEMLELGMNCTCRSLDDCSLAIQS